MAGSVRAGRIGVVAVAGVIALAIAALAIVMAVNPPFQTQTSPRPAASSSGSASPSPSGSTHPTPSYSATPTPTAAPTVPASPFPSTAPETHPTADPVPDDSSFRRTVTPILDDAKTGLNIIKSSTNAGDYGGVTDVTTQLRNDLQRLHDNPKPSDPNTWENALQTYAAALTELEQAVASSDGSRVSTALDSVSHDVNSLVRLTQ